MNAALQQKRPSSGEYYERWYDARGDCVSVLFESETYQQWLGVFGIGDLPSQSTSLLFCVEPAAFIIAGGQGYAVDVNTGDLTHNTECSMLVGAVSIPGRALVIAHDFSHLYAYSPRGQVWRSDQVASDEVRLEGVSADHVEGKLWLNGEWRGFRLRFDDFEFDLLKWR